MAKNDFESAVKKAIDEVLEDFKPAMEEAVNNAVMTAQKDFLHEAFYCLEEYYSNYDTERYARTDTLQYAFLPYAKVRFLKDRVKGSVGVQYSPEALMAHMPPPTTKLNGKISHTGYYGSSKYQPVDAWWVIDNYLKGIHPVTNGGTTSKTSVYYEIYDDVSPDQKMKKFERQYMKTFNENVSTELIKQIIKKIK